MIAVLGLDIGLATFGWALLRVTADELTLVDLGCITTSKGKGKGVLVTDDLHRRGMELTRELGELDPVPHLICAESQSLPRDASVAAQIGRAWGVVDAYCEDLSVPLLNASPQAIKKAATGRRNASKVEVQQALDEHLGGTLAPRLAELRKGLREHPADAVGAVWACRNHDHLRLALRARGAA